MTQTVYVEIPFLKGGENHDLYSQDFNSTPLSSRSKDSDYKLLQSRNLTLNPFPLTVTTLLLTSFKATTLLPTNQLTLIDLDFTNSP